MRKLSYITFVGLVVIALVVGLAPSATQAASHREAPLISMDPTADITDFFMFRSYEAGRDDKIVLIMDRSEEHTSELQSPRKLVCRLLLETKKNELQLHTTRL